MEDASCTEDFNLRSKIIAFASTQNDSRYAQSAHHRDQLSAYDVKWSHGRFDSTIATVAANGRIIIYDLNSTSVEIARLHEHTRQVHRIAFNPHQGALLLSGSQDATIRMWDLRALGDERSVRTFNSIRRFQGNNESIRDLKWSPSDGVEFASGTDNGSVQRWDFRKEAAPIMKLNAHEKSCHSIDWHPSGNFLASGGADKVVKVWNFKSSDRRMKPIAQLRTPQGVRNLRWRPSPTELEGSGARISEPSFLATAYDAKDPRIHIWDFRRPHVPFQELDRYNTPATGILWHSEDLLWSVGSAGAFTQTDLKFAPKPVERRNTNILAMAPDGTICAFFNEKPRRRVIFGDSLETQLPPQSTGANSEEKYSSSQSANEGSPVEPNLLNSSIRKRRQKLANTQLAANAAQVAAYGAAENQKEPPLLFRAIYESSQSGFLGHILGLSDPNGFTYLAENYILPSTNFLMLRDFDCHDSIRSIFESNAKVAEQVGLYRLAQSWRILGQATYQELLRRAQASKQIRVTGSSYLMHTSSAVEPNKPEEKESITRFGGKNLEPISNTDDKSNLSTPLARPVKEVPSVPTAPDVALNSITNDTFQYRAPASKAGQNLQDSSSKTASSDLSAPLPVLSEPLEPTSKLPISGSDKQLARNGNATLTPFKGFHDMEAEMQAKRIAISNYRAKPRAVLNLDSPFESSRALSATPRLDRHDSEESFQMFSASIDSEHHSLVMPESFEDRQKLVLSETLEDTRMSGSQINALQGSSFKSQLQLEGPPGFGVNDSFLNDEEIMLRKPDSSPKFTNNLLHLSPVYRPDTAFPPKILVRNPIRTEDIPRDLSLQEFDSSDFSPPANLPPDLPPWNICSLIPPLLDYHLERLSDAQLPSILALHLSALFPFLFAEMQTLTYLSSYHQQLLSLQLYGSAAEFRRVCELPFPDIADKVIGPGIADWYCRNCKRPVKGENTGLCNRCEQQWGACAVCETTAGQAPVNLHPVKASHVKGQSSGEGLRLWIWCQGCGHGGHSTCLASWFADTSICEGTCAIVGCVHDCVEGPEREATVVRIEREKSKGRSRSVVRDEWDVGQSKAVERTRMMVGDEVQSRRSGSTGGYRGLGGSEVPIAASPELDQKARADALLTDNALHESLADKDLVS